MIAIRSEGASISTYGKFTLEVTNEQGIVTTTDLVKCSTVLSEQTLSQTSSSFQQAIDRMFCVPSVRLQSGALVGLQKVTVQIEKCGACTSSGSFRGSVYYYTSYVGDIGSEEIQSTFMEKGLTGDVTLVQKTNVIQELGSPVFATAHHEFT